MNAPARPTKRKPREAKAKEPSEAMGTRKQEKPLNLYGYKPEDVLRKMMNTPPPPKK